MDERDFQAGFVAIVGRPNVGKSTLLNTLVETRVSIVTPKPQTTRHRIRGIRTTQRSQIVFIDTPGVHRGSRHAMSRALNRAAIGAISEADLVLFVVEALRWTGEDEQVLEKIKLNNRPTIVCINKVDRVRPKSDLLPFLESTAARGDFVAMLPISATKGINCDALLNEVELHLPVAGPLYPEDQVTDQSEAFRAGETVREQLMLQLQEEVPYGTMVEIEGCEREEGRLYINATIWVERASQKPIVIGQHGRRIRSIGRAARLALNDRFGLTTHLELWVKVKEHWADDERLLKQLGYEVP